MIDLTANELNARNKGFTASTRIGLFGSVYDLRAFRLTMLRLSARLFIGLIPVIAFTISFTPPGLAQSNLENEARKSGVLPTEQPIEIEADTLNVKEGVLTARGNVVLKQGNMIVRANHVTFNRKNNELTAKGKVRVNKGGDIVNADRIELRLKKSTDVIYRFQTRPFRKP